MGAWCVKRLASKTCRVPNAKGEGKVTVELVDEATAIQATVWKDAIDKYDAVLEVGKVYYVAKGFRDPRTSSTPPATTTTR